MSNNDGSTGTQLHLLDTTTDILKFSCRIYLNLLSLVNQNEPGVQKSQILRIIQFQPCDLFDQITSAIHLFNRKGEQDESAVNYLTIDDFLQIVIIYGVFPTKLQLRLSFICCDLVDDVNVSDKNFVHLVNILSGNKINVPDVMHFYTEQSKGGKTLVRTEDLLELFVKNNLYILQKAFVESIQNSIFSTRVSNTIKYKIHNINEIKKYQMQHNGEFPPLPCFDNLIRIINKQPHPYSYDFIGADMNDIFNFLRKLKHILMSNLKVYKVSGVAQHPMLSRIKRHGSSRGMQYSLTKNNSCKSLKSLSGLIPTTNNIAANVMSQCSESVRNAATFCSPLSARCITRNSSITMSKDGNNNINNSKPQRPSIGRTHSAALRAKSPLYKHRLVVKKSNGCEVENVREEV